MEHQPLSPESNEYGLVKNHSGYPLLILILTLFVLIFISQICDAQVITPPYSSNYSSTSQEKFPTENPIKQPDTAVSLNTPACPAPVAADDSVPGWEDTGLKIFVLQNDLIPICANVQVNLVTNLSAQGAGIAINPDSTVQYDPIANFFGWDSFEYVLCNDSFCDTSTVTLYIQPVNDFPLCSADFVSLYEDQIIVPIDVLNNDSDNLDPYGSINPFSIDTVNGPQFGLIFIDNLSGRLFYVPYHNFSGKDSLQYSVCDMGGPGPDLCDTAWVIIEVLPVNDYPEAQNDFVEMGEDTAQISVYPLNNDSDPDDPEGYLPQTGFEIISGPFHGMYVYSDSLGTLHYTPNANYNGSDSLMYRICDNGAPLPFLYDTAWIYFSISAINDAPIATSQSITILEDTDSTHINISQNCSDASDPKGGIDNSSIVLLAGPFNGSVSPVSINGIINYTPDLNFFGKDSIQYVICDLGFPLPALCDTAWLRITVTPDNDPPVTGNDYFLCTEDSNTTFDVLSNDFDTDNAPQSLDTNSLNLISGPLHGVFSIESGTGNITYQPYANYYGKDSMLYVLFDQGDPALSDTAWIIIDVLPVNDWPVAVHDFITISQNTPTLVQQLANDHDGLDPDGAIEPNSLEIIPGSGPWNGTITVNPDNSTLIYSPDIYYSGMDSVAYKICDDGYPLPGLCDTAWIFFNVADDDSSVYALNDTIHIMEDDPVVMINPAQNDFSSAGILFAPGEFKLDMVTGSLPNHGLLFLDSILQRFFYIPDLDYYGMDSLQYVITDISNPSLITYDTAWLFIEILPVNDRPIARYDYILIPPDTANVAIPVLDNDADSRDPEGNLDSTSLQVLNAFGPGHGSYVLNLNDGEVIYTPDSGYTGTDSILYQICDDGYPAPSMCIYAWIIITITNQPDSVSSPKSEIVLNAQNDTIILTEDTFISIISPATTDFNYPIGVIVDYQVDSIPGTGTWNGQVFLDSLKKNFLYVPNPNFHGTDSIQYVIQWNNSVDTAWIFFNVLPVNDAPVIQSDTMYTSQNIAVSGSVILNDSDKYDLTGNIDHSSVSIVPNYGAKHGTISIDPVTGDVTYLPDLNFTGTDSAQYAVCDDGEPLPAQCATGWIYFEVQPSSPPVADQQIIYDSIFIGDSTSFCINLINNTSNKSVFHSQLIKFPYKGFAKNNSPMDSCWTYQSDSTSLGNDIFAISVCDTTTSMCDSIMVVVSIFPREIIANNDTIECHEGMVSMNLTANDTIPSSLSPNLVIVEGPKNGYTSMDSNGQIMYTPYVDSCSKDSFVYELCHPQANCDTATVVVLITPKDSDSDGIPDYIETKLLDTDSNGIPDYLSTDSDGDLIPDREEGVDPTSSACHIVLLDCDEDGVPDYIDPDSCHNTTEMVLFPEGFSPDGNNINDYYVIGDLDKYPNNSFTVYNRWGNRVFYRAPYQNDWDGTNEGSPSIGDQLPAGTYFYLFEFGPGKPVKKGYLYLNRK